MPRIEISVELLGGYICRAHLHDRLQLLREHLPELAIILPEFFVENGFDLLITADESRIQDAAHDIESLGAKVFTVQADLTKEDEVKRLWNEILARGVWSTQLP